MGTEVFHPERLILTMSYASDVFREDVEAAFDRIGCVPFEQAEHLVATSGEDERTYSVVARATFLEVLYRTADEFLADDDGGYHRMNIHLCAYDRSDAVLEFWFHCQSVASTGGGVWLRQMAVKLDDERVFAALGR